MAKRQYRLTNKGRTTKVNIKTWLLNVHTYDLLKFMRKHPYKKYNRAELIVYLTGDPVRSTIRERIWKHSLYKGAHEMNLMVELRKLISQGYVERV